MVVKNIFRNKLTVSVLCTAALLVLLYSVIPLTIDDWSWGGNAGISRLSNFFDGYNGRYLGNLFVIALTRSKVARVVLMTAGSVCLCLGVYHYAFGKTNSAAYYLLCVFLIFACFFSGILHPKLNLFSQTLAWCSGYANYVIPTILLVVYMCVADRDFRHSLNSTASPLSDSAVHCIGMALLGFSTCLFLENMTLFCFGLGFAVLFYFLFVHGKIFRQATKKFYPSHAAYCGGTLAGAVAMFSNSSYRLIAKGTYSGDDAVTINGAGFRKIGIISLRSVSDSFGKLGLPKAVLPVCIVVLLAAAVAVGALPLLVTKDKAQRLRLYSPLLFMVLITVPLLFANGAHPYLFTVRLYFPQYVLFVIFLLQVITLLIQNKPKKLKVIGKVMLSVMLCVLIAANVFIYSNIHRTDRLNETLIAQQLDNGTEPVRIIVYSPMEQRFVFAANAFAMTGWAPRYKDYYGIDENKELKPVTYKAYLKHIQQQE